MKINQYFSNDYFEAREKFLQLCSENNFKIQSHLNPNAKGPDNKNLYMDIGIRNDKASKNALVLISGTHGPEGYCGSGIQCAFLAQGLADKYCEKFNIILIHAHNPYGFAWDTRFNEDNIDLNRNYLDDFSKLPENPEYDKLAQWALPEDFSQENLDLSTAKLMEYAQNNGFAALQNALTSGQYRHKNGVYYGGIAPSWSHETMIEIMDQIAINNDNMIIIDIHTGLGPFGHGEILSDINPNDQQFANLTNIWGEDVTSNAAGASISASLKGSMDCALMKRYRDKNPAIIAIEFGTIDPLSVFRATQASSWLHSYGDINSQIGQKYRQLSRDAFYPQSDEWKQKTWQRSLQLLQKAYDYY